MEGEERPDSGRALIRWMAQSDPAQAVALAREFGDAKGESQALADWARRDPVAAAAALRPDAAELTQAVVSIAENLARHDCSAFEAWVASLNDSVSRAAARRTVLGFEADSDPAGTARAAAAWLAAEPAAAQSVANLTGNIAKQWALAGAPPSPGWETTWPRTTRWPPPPG